MRRIEILVLKRFALARPREVVIRTARRKAVVSHGKNLVLLTDNAGSHLCIRIFGAHPRQGRNAHKVFIPADIIRTFSAHVPITPTCVRRIKQILFRAENTVSRISESRYNVAVLVQMIVERADVDIHIRMCLLHLFHTFRCCDNAHQADIFYAFIL